MKQVTRYCKACERNQSHLSDEIHHDNQEIEPIYCCLACGSYDNEPARKQQEAALVPNR